MTLWLVGMWPTESLFSTTSVCTSSRDECNPMVCWNVLKHSLWFYHFVSGWGVTLPVCLSVVGTSHPCNVTEIQPICLGVEDFSPCLSVVGTNHPCNVAGHKPQCTGALVANSSGICHMTAIWSNKRTAFEDNCAIRFVLFPVYCYRTLAR